MDLDILLSIYYGFEYSTKEYYMKEQGNTLFTEDELHGNPATGFIQVSTNLIRGGSTVKKKKIMRGGIEVMISEATPNDKKIEDTCIEIFQTKEIRKKINYDELQDEALNVLSEKFSEYGLITSDDFTKSKNKLILNTRKIAVDNYIKNSVAESIPKTIKFPIKEFIKRTGITRIQGRFNEALKVISESSTKLSHSWMSQTVEFKDKNGKKVAEIKNDLTQGSIIPKFKLRFNDKIKKHLSEDEIRAMTIESFIELDVPNKSSYIDEIIMETDPETVVEIIGVGLFGSLFGKGYARSERRNRNLYKKSATFNFDLLVRSIINIPHNTTLTEFTFDQLKDILGASSYNKWESFKKSVLLPVLKEQELYTEVKCEYILLPSQKNWTHIKLIPSWKTTSLGFEAEKRGFDYLAYFIAVQHKFFQANSLDESLEHFIPHVQSAIYSFNDEDMVWGKTLLEWKIYTKKVYEVEKELLEFISQNQDILDDNNIFYDERLLCLLKRNFKEEEILEENNELKKKQKKNSYITTNMYRVQDPITSLRYLNELLVKGKEDSNYYIFDFIPFQFASMEGGWKSINTLEDYQQYKDPIRSAIYKKKGSFFRFEEEEVNKKENFLLNVERGSFKEIDERFKLLMQEISS